jgi:hypothetical protein
VRRVAGVAIIELSRRCTHWITEYSRQTLNFDLNLTNMSSSLVISVPEDQKTDSVTDLSTPFDLERIKIEYICLQPGQSHKQTIPPRCNHFCYVITGTGSLLTSDENEDPALLKVDDCFSFPSHINECRYTVHVSSEKSLSLITFTDVPNPEAIALVSITKPSWEPIQTTLIY